MERLINIGPVSAERLRAVGVHSAAELERLGAVAAYLRVKERYPEETTLVLLYALEGALLDERWDQLSPSVMQRLRSAVSS